MSVRITTLGQVRVSVAGRDRSSLPQQRLRCALLIYVAVEASCTRESLIGVFWPDRPSARARRILNQNVYELRQAVGDDAIRTEGDRVVIGPDVSVDVREFEDDVEAGAIDSALSAYRGAFLDGFTLPNSNGFDLWVERKRATIERLHRRARRMQIDALESAGDHAGALAAAHAWADIDPLEDEAQHRLFELLLASGRRIEARTRFDEYCCLLREELEVEPLEETIALFRTESGTEAAAKSDEGEGAGSDEASLDSSIQGGEAEREGPGEVAMPAARTAGTAGAFGTNTKSGAPPRRRIAWRRGIVAALGAAALAFVAARLIDRSPTPQSLALPIDSAGYDPSRIAVLYFEDISEGHDVGHIASGLTEALITEFDRVEALSVVSRDGVKPFVDSIVPPQQIAATLRAGSIVAGSLQRSGNQLRLTVQLIEGATGNLLKSATFQRPMGELFELQDDLARRVARILRDRIGREVNVRRLTRAGKPKAWELVRRAIETGEELWLSGLLIPPERKRSAMLELESADEYLRRAERIDPHWPEPTRLRGWVALGRAKTVGPYDTTAYNREIRAGLAIVANLFRRGFDGAREYELRGTLRSKLAMVNQANERYLAVRDSAVQDLRMAVSRDPTLAAASSRLSEELLLAGNPREARYYANHALGQDAYLRGGPDLQYRLYNTSMELDDATTARSHCLRGRIDYPQDWRFVHCQLLIALYGGEPISPDSAQVLLRAWRQLDPPRPDQPAQYTHVFRRIVYAAVLAQTGQHESARDSLKRIRHTIEQNPERLAQPFGLDEASVLLMLGDTAEALRAIDGYIAQNPMYRAYVERSLQTRPLHGDPRLLEILRDTAEPDIHDPP